MIWIMFLILMSPASNKRTTAPRIYFGHDDKEATNR